MPIRNQRYVYPYPYFANNHYPTEVRTASNAFTRPYWEDGVVRYRMPKSCRWLREIGNHGSYLVYFLFNRIDLLMARIHSPESPTDRAISREPGSPAVRVTAELLGRMKQRCGDIPLFAFCMAADADTAAPIEAFLANQGLTVIPGMAALLAEHDGANQAMRVQNDSHLNEDGEALLGQALAAWLAAHAELWRNNREVRTP